MTTIIEEVRAARAAVAANKTGWVKISPTWFASSDDMARYLVERNKKRQIAILDAIISVLEQRDNA